MTYNEAWTTLESVREHTCNYGPYYEARHWLELDDPVSAVGALESWLHYLDQAKRDISAKITELKQL